MDQTEQTSKQLEKDKRETVAKLSVSWTWICMMLYVIASYSYVYFSYLQHPYNVMFLLPPLHTHTHTHHRRGAGFAREGSKVLLPMCGEDVTLGVTKVLRYFTTRMLLRALHKGEFTRDY